MGWRRVSEAVTAFSYNEMSSSSQPQFERRRGRVSPTLTGFPFKLCFVGSAGDEGSLQWHLVVQGPGCIHWPTLPLHCLRSGGEKSVGAWKLSMVNIRFPRSCPAQPPSTSFFSSGQRFALKYSLSRTEGAFLYIRQLNLSPSLPAFLPLALTTTGKLQIFLLQDSQIIGSTPPLKSVSDRGRRGAEGVGFCAYWKKSSFPLNRKFTRIADCTFLSFQQRPVSMPVWEMS